MGQRVKSVPDPGKDLCYCLADRSVREFGSESPCRTLYVTCPRNRRRPFGGEQSSVYNLYICTGRRRINDTRGLVYPRKTQPRKTVTFIFIFILSLGPISRVGTAVRARGRDTASSFIKNPSGPVQSGGKLTATPQCRPTNARVHTPTRNGENENVYTRPTTNDKRQNDAPYAHNRRVLV